MNEELEYVLETIRFKTSIYRDKKKRNLTFNDDDYYSNILNEYITDLQQENARLKDKIQKATNFVDKYMDEWDFQDEVWQDMNDLLILLKEN